jgi:hypothetical protein
VESTAPLSVQQTGLLVLGKDYAELAQYAGIVPLRDKLVRLSPRDIRIVEGVVQLMTAENGVK